MQVNHKSIKLDLCTRKNAKFLGSEEEDGDDMPLAMIEKHRDAK